jgi:hypothetical protein
MFFQSRTKLVNDSPPGKRHGQKTQFHRQTDEVLNFIKRWVVNADCPTNKRQGWWLPRACLLTQRQ